MTYSKGNKIDNKHYWLTPDELLAEIYQEYDIDFDPCPYPKPDDFDGLTAEWGESNYVNPPFGGYMDQHKNKKIGPTAWARKAIEESKKGKRVVFVYPIDKWILMFLEAGAKIRNLYNVKWCAIEDGTPGKGTGRWVAMFVLDPNQKKDNKKMSENSTFDVFAIVELMGHSRIAGRVTEQVIAGTALLRVDVPALPARGQMPEQPAFTRFFGASAIYSITPCSEEIALRAAESMRVAPINVYLAYPQLERAPDRGLEWDEDHEEIDEDDDNLDL